MTLNDIRSDHCKLEAVVAHLKQYISILLEDLRKIMQVWSKDNKFVVGFRLTYIYLSNTR